MPSTITRYSYVGVPMRSKAEERAGPVKMRQKKMQEQKVMDSYNGGPCKHFS